MPAIYPDLLNKTVLITGGADGIGAATASLFTQQGSKVIILDIADAAAERTIAHASSQPPLLPTYPPTTHTPVYYHCDITDLPTLQSTASEILTTHGPIHILINNAAATGAAGRFTTETATSAAWDASVNANLRHVFFLTQAVIPGMKSLGGGSIVNLGSITWRIPDGRQPVYAACKAAIMGLTRVQSKELGGHDIRVNSVMPGAIATRRQREEVLTEEYRAEVMRGQSLQRDLVPEEVGRVVLFLASGEASAVTGSSYVVDGGWCSDP
ncbi:SDR family NAD(P)-dependent oxidoreductase [Aspergillus candidus]|uniref:Short chain dehydrogenase n=1 Tax=Aspergillus candidus TaxID=41067 RepID=A0A2I2FKB3_ASPCN|nr:hypothetical protein BDW47DRAFT_134183 [Aspergillus candidus]PLB41061.1 hypothetical protein BDW47DRAFT_134183 [Aspergillus candidus]